MKSVERQKTDTIFVLMVFVIFAISVLLVLMFSASVYGNVSETLREEKDERAVLSYIWTKVRSFDEADSIAVADFHGIPALFINEDFEGMRFHTIIYHYDGRLHELFSDAQLEFYPVDGLPILAISDLNFSEIEYGLIRVTSGERSLLLSLRSQTQIPIRRGDSAG
jgi:hypothetical protein